MLVKDRKLPATPTLFSFGSGPTRGLVRDENVYFDVLSQTAISDARVMETLRVIGENARKLVPPPPGSSPLYDTVS